MEDLKPRTHNTPYVHMKRAGDPLGAWFHESESFIGTLHDWDSVGK